MIELHKWTHTGNKVLALKNLPKDGKAYGGFQWPLAVGAKVTVPTEKWDGCDKDDVKLGWKAYGACGHGLHVWFWGMGLGDGRVPDWNGLWMVVAADPADTALIKDGLKGKVRECKIVLIGTYNECMQYTISGRIAWIANAAKGNVANGDRSAASANGDSSAASANGDSSAASANGYRSAASANGYRSAASVIGEYATVEVLRGACQAVAQHLFWKARKDSVLLQWWTDDKNVAHHALFTCRPKWDGKTVEIVCGKVKGIDNDAN